MGFSRKRTGRDGKPRYTAYYKDLKDRERSAGTYSSLKEADKAWQRAESRLAEGRVGDPARGRMTFQRYVEEKWLPNHEMEATTRQSYTYSIYKHIMPEFGPMRMVDILPEHVRAWIGRLKDRGVTPVTIKYNKVILSAIFTTALNDQVTFLHPCKGVKTPTVAAKPRVIITPEQFDMLYGAGGARSATGRATGRTPGPSRTRSHRVVIRTPATWWSGMPRRSWRSRHPKCGQIRRGTISAGHVSPELRYASYGGSPRPAGSETDAPDTPFRSTRLAAQRDRPAGPQVQPA